MGPCHTLGMFEPSRLVPDARVRFPGEEDAVTLVRVREGSFWEFVSRPFGQPRGGDAA